MSSCNQAIYQSNSARFSFELGNKDGEFLAAPQFREIVPRFKHLWDEKVVQPRDDLLASATAILRAIKDDPLLLYEYSYTMTIARLPENMQGLGIITSIVIGGRRYDVDTRVACCQLRELEINQKGQGLFTERTVDIRHRTTIHTDDCDVVHIHKRKIRNLTWPKQLPRLIEFLQKQPDDYITVWLKPPTPTIMELVHAYCTGPGSDDDVAECLTQMGDEAKLQLLKKLNDRRVSKHHPVIAELLLLQFPSLESRHAVEQLAQNHPEPQKRAIFEQLISHYGHLSEL